MENGPTKFGLLPAIGALAMSGCLHTHNYPAPQSTDIRMSIEDIQSKIYTFDGLNKLSIEIIPAHYYPTTIPLLTSEEYASTRVLTRPLDSEHSGPMNGKLDEHEFINTFTDEADKLTSALPSLDLKSIIALHRSNWQNLLDYDANVDGSLGVDDDVNCDGFIDTWDHMYGQRVECVLQTYRAQHPHSVNFGFNREDPEVLDKRDYLTW